MYVYIYRFVKTTYKESVAIISVMGLVLHFNKTSLKQHAIQKSSKSQELLSQVQLSDLLTQPHPKQQLSSTKRPWQQYHLPTKNLEFYSFAVVPAPQRRTIHDRRIQLTVRKNPGGHYGHSFHFCWGEI